MAQGARALIGTFLDALLPPQCVSCRELVMTPGQLCAACWRDVTFLSEPSCFCCGLPFEYEIERGARCGACVRRPPPYGRARSVFVYDDASRNLVLAMKWGDRLEAAPSFGRWMARAGKELLADADVIAAVPLHWTRLFRRRFNQSALLAQEIGRASGVPVLVDALARRRATPSQGGFSRRARLENVRGAFEVRKSRLDAVENRTILLIDDVLTTGATVASCAQALLKAGAASVDVLTLARVVYSE